MAYGSATILFSIWRKKEHLVGRPIKRKGANVPWERFVQEK